MTWVEYHKKSEQLASEAEAANYKGEAGRAQELYRQAAELEEKALSVLDRQKIKTLGITAVSAAALWYKAGQFQQAHKIARDWLTSGILPSFAIAQLNDLLKKLPEKSSHLLNAEAPAEAKLYPLSEGNLVNAFEAPPKDSLRQQTRSHELEGSTRQLKVSVKQTPRKLLLIENNPAYLQTMTEFFTEYGYEVLSATTVEAASRLLAAHAADLAVTEIRLRNDEDEQDQSGLTLAKQYGTTLPIIILTSYPTWELAREALRPTLNMPPPAVDFVFKGEGLSKLLLVIETNLAKE